MSCLPTTQLSAVPSCAILLLTNKAVPDMLLWRRPSGDIAALKSNQRPATSRCICFYASFCKPCVGSQTQRHSASGTRAALRKSPHPISFWRRPPMSKPT
ncbi:hypothetical protein P154DRAFT_192533 [Amniculicola lignicola CBS 123094]|uniref:Uncharacterized protein n=1 Tax=Amniculicola lignicola CBS 123094 TaxID=1392246 RepID=A0A6A5WFK1_9PLEO|nr:hypothetical protein P154DRAFT_192533 [Amniculicola lignicola CBS 123094]